MNSTHLCEGDGQREAPAAVREPAEQGVHGRDGGPAGTNDDYTIDSIRF